MLCDDEKAGTGYIVYTHTPHAPSLYAVLLLLISLRSSHKGGRERLVSFYNIGFLHRRKRGLGSMIFALDCFFPSTTNSIGNSSSRSSSSNAPRFNRLHLHVTGRENKNK